MNKKTNKIVMAALFAALCCSFTYYIHVSLPYGYANLGDVIVLLGAVLLGPLYGAIAAGVGAALADLFMGYAQYIPGTFVIKAIVALICAFLYRLLNRSGRTNVVFFIVSAVFAEGFMVCGYYLYEAVILPYGFAGAVESVFGNVFQGIVGVTLSAFILIPVSRLFDKFGK